MTTYDWVIDGGAAGGGVTTHSGARPLRNWSSCNNEIVTITLTVSDGAAASDVTTQSVMLPNKLRQALSGSDLHSSFTSLIGVAPHDGSSSGSVVVNGANLANPSNTGPFQLEVEGRRGVNTVEAILSSSAAGEGVWTFDFSRSEHFVWGSIRVEYGSLLFVERGRIVFRLSGAGSERLKFTYRLAN